MGACSASRSGARLAAAARVDPRLEQVIGADTDGPKGAPAALPRHLPGHSATDQADRRGGHSVARAMTTAGQLTHACPRNGRVPRPRERANLLANPSASVVLCHFEVVARLEPHPHSGACAEVVGESHRRVGGDGALAMHDLADAHGRDAQVLRHAALAESERLHKVLKQHFAWMNGWEGRHRECSLRVVVHDLHVVGAPAVPDEADSPLGVDANGVLAGAISAKLLQAIARRRAQVAKVLGVVQVQQLAPGSSLDVQRQLPRDFAAAETLGLPVGKRLDHDLIVSPLDSAVKKARRSYLRLPPHTGGATLCPSPSQHSGERSKETRRCGRNSGSSPSRGT